MGHLAGAPPRRQSYDRKGSVRRAGAVGGLRRCAPTPRASVCPRLAPQGAAPRRCPPAENVRAQTLLVDTAGVGDGAAGASDRQRPGSANSMISRRLMTADLSGIKRTQPVNGQVQSAVRRRCSGRRPARLRLESRNPHKSMVEAICRFRRTSYDPPGSDISDAGFRRSQPPCARRRPLGAQGRFPAGGAATTTSTSAATASSPLPADHELKAAEEVARISQGDRDAEAAPAADT